MEEKELQVFIKGTTRYFQQVCGEEVSIDPPFIKNQEGSTVLAFTGIIGISGKRKGAVYFSAEREMLAELLASMGEAEVDTDLLRDAIGEIANTISGNAREEFGGEFMISVPIVVEGKPEAISFPKDTAVFVIPIVWRIHRCYLLIGLL